MLSVRKHCVHDRDTFHVFAQPWMAVSCYSRNLWAPSCEFKYGRAGNLGWLAVAQSENIDPGTETTLPQASPLLAPCPVFGPVVVDGNEPPIAEKMPAGGYARDSSEGRHRVCAAWFHAKLHA
jgi:hypothetical protein